MAKPSKRSKKGGKHRTRKNICNPNSRKNKVFKDTCFTPNALELLKKLYNTENPKNPITGKDPRNILREMREKVGNTCKEDICIIDKFTTNNREKKMLQTLLYPPPKPTEWDTSRVKQDEDIWLSDEDIKDVLNQYEQAYPEFSFIGPSPIDYNTRLKDKQCVCPKLCNLNIENCLYPKDGNYPTNKIGIVFNLDPHYKGGSHWVALFVDMIDYFIFYFDSTGAKIPRLIHELVNNIQSQGLSLTVPKQFIFDQNDKTEHQKSNTECGMYCLYFTITMLLREKEIDYDVTNQNKKMTKEELFSLFKGGKNKKKRIKDELVYKKRNEYFSTPII